MPIGSAEGARDIRADRLRQAYDLHAQPVYYFLLKLTFGERQAAEDLLQEVFIRAWRHIDALNPDATTLRPWLYTVARRVAIDAGRARLSRPATLSLDANLLASPEPAIDRVVTAEAVRGALRRLDHEHRSVLLAIYFEGRSVAETARLLGIPVGTVKSRVHYAMRSLRKAFASL